MKREMKANQYLLISYCEKKKTGDILLVNQEGLVVSNVSNSPVDESFAKQLMLWIPNPLDTSCIAESIQVFRLFTNQLLKVLSKNEKNFVFSLKTKYLSLFSDLEPDVLSVLLPVSKNFSITNQQQRLFLMHQLLMESLTDSNALEARIKKAKEVSLENVQNKTLEDVVALLTRVAMPSSLEISFNESGIKEYGVSFKDAPMIKQTSLDSLYKQILLQTKKPV